MPDVTPQTDDATLATLARDGDRSAVATLLERHERRLYHVVLGMLRHRDDAADVTQDALVKVVQNLDGFRGDAQVTTWMTRIAMNQAISFLRKQKRRPTTSLDAERNGHSGEGQAYTLRHQLEQQREPSPSHGVEQQEQEDRLRDAIAALDEPFRAVLVLRDLDQMDYQQIAEALDLPLGTVKSRLFRARLMLRDLLRADDPMEPTLTPGLDTQA